MDSILQLAYLLNGRDVPCIWGTILPEELVPFLLFAYYQYHGQPCGSARRLWARARPHPLTPAFSSKQLRFCFFQVPRRSSVQGCGLRDYWFVVVLYVAKRKADGLKKNIPICSSRSAGMKGVHLQGSSMCKDVQRGVGGCGGVDGAWSEVT